MGKTSCHRLRGVFRGHGGEKLCSEQILKRILVVLRQQYALRAMYTLLTSAAPISMVRLACAFAIISFVRHNHPFTGGNVIQSDFVRANRLFTGGDDLSVVEVTKIWTDGKTEPTRLFAKFTLAVHLPLRAFYGTLSAKVALKKAHFVSVSVMTRSLRSDSRFATVLRRSEMVCWRLSIVEFI